MMRTTLRRLGASAAMTLIATLDGTAADATTSGIAPLPAQSHWPARPQVSQDTDRRAAPQPNPYPAGAERSGSLGPGATRPVAEADGVGSQAIPPARSLGPAGPSCPGASYRKKLAVAAFSLAHAEHAADILEPGQGFAMELLRALESTGRHLVRNAVSVNLFPAPEQAPAVGPYGDPRAVVALGGKVDAQLVVAGSLLDLGIRDSVYVRGANQVTSLFGFHLEPVQRSVRVGLYLYDSLTGNTLLERTYDRTVFGDVYFARGTPFSSREFLDSGMGRAVRDIIAQQVADLTAQVDCLRLTERVLRVERPYVHINAGSTSNVQVGDTLEVYRQTDKPLPGVYYQNSRLLGYTEALQAMLTVTQVQPSFAIGRLETEAATVSPGDLVRSR